MSLTLYNVVIRKIPDHFSLYADPIMVFKTFTPLLWELRQPSQFILYGVVDAVYDWFPEKNKPWHLFQNTNSNKFVQNISEMAVVSL